MSQIREAARAALQHLALPVPERERTLRVVVPKGTVPPNGIRCLCAIPAMYAWRTAHENGCTKIIVEDGTGHRHQFDTSELLRHAVKKRLGALPIPKTVGGRVPRFLATAGHMALGNRLEPSRQFVTVPIAVSGSTPAAQGG